MFKDFFRIQRHQMIIWETKLGFYLNFKYRKYPVKVLRHFCVAIIFDVLFFWLQGPLKKNLSLEPLLQLATFIDGVLTLKIFWKKIEKFSVAAGFAAAKNGVQKRRNFS